MDWLFLSQGKTLGGAARTSYHTVLWPFLVANLAFLGFCQGNFHYEEEGNWVKRQNVTWRWEDLGGQTARANN